MNDAHYKNGALDGKWTKWYDTGMLEEQGQYKNDEKSGDWIFYDKYGVKYKKQQFLKGIADGPWVTYFSNGNKESQGENSKGYKEGKWIYWDQYGKVIYMVTYKHGKKLSEFPTPKVDVPVKKDDK